MKRRIFPLLCSLALMAGTFLGCTQQPDPTVATVSPPAPDTAPQTITLHLITERVSGSTDKTPTYRTRAVYDERGLATDIIHEDFAIPKQSYHHVYHYNDHGHLLYRTTLENGEETNKTPAYAYHYNPDGTISSIDGYIAEEGTVVFEYDEQGRLSKATTTYFDGKPWVYALCKYNDAGLLTEFSTSYLDKPTGATYGRVEKFAYDELGRLKGVEYPTSYSCEYDKYGNVIRENDLYYTYSAPDGVIVSAQDTKNPTCRYIFDELGRLVRFENGDWYTQWTYQTIEVPVENLNMAIQFYTRTNEWPGMQCYYNNIMNYLLPKSGVIF